MKKCGIDKDRRGEKNGVIVNDLVSLKLNHRLYAQDARVRQLRLLYRPLRPCPSLSCLPMASVTEEAVVGIVTFDDVLILRFA